MNKDEVARVARVELDNALQRAASSDDGRTALALAYYEGRYPQADDDEVKERAIVSLDVADMTEAVYAQIAPAFEDAGAVEFEALNGEDETAARMESEIVRAMLIEGRGSDGAFVAITEAVKNCLLTRKGVMALDIVKEEAETPEKWELVPELAVADKLNPTQEGQRVEEVTVKEMTPAEIEKAGGAPEGVDGPFYRISLTRVDVTRRLEIEAVRPEDFVTSSVTERDPNKARFCAHRIVLTRAALVSHGIDESVAASLPACDPTAYVMNVTRSPGEDAFNAAQKSGDLVEVWRCYALLGKTKDAARGERYRFLYSRDAGKVLTDPERVGLVCYAVGNTMIFPHRLDGVSLFDRLGEIQEAKSLALRQWAENLTRLARPRLGVDETLTNLDDAMDATQDVIRVKGPNALIPIPILDAGGSAMAFMDYQDRMRSERGGASLDMQTATAQIATNQTAQGIERQYSVKEQLAAMMARTFAETALRSVYRIAHYLLRTQWGVSINAKVGGQWVAVDPGQWRPRNGVLIRVGQSHTERMRRAQALGQVLQQQQVFMQAGLDGELVDQSKLFNAASDWIAATQLRAPDRYLVDPASPEAAKARESKQQQQQAQQAQAAALQRAVMLLEKYKVDIEALTKATEQIVKAAIEEAKLTLAPEPLQAAQMVAGENRDQANADANKSEAAASPGGAGR